MTAWRVALHVDSHCVYCAACCVGCRRLQPARSRAQHGERGLERDRRPAKAPTRSDPEPGGLRQGLLLPRARPVRQSGANPRRKPRVGCNPRQKRGRKRPDWSSQVAARRRRGLSRTQGQRQLPRASEKPFRGGRTVSLDSLPIATNSTGTSPATAGASQSSAPRRS